jgi:hypothetical protein
MWLRRAVSMSRRSAPATLVLLFGCGGDAECVLYPCPEFEAVRVSVTASTAASTLPGLSIAIGGSQQSSGPCDPLTRVCHVFGGAGSYQLTVSATGYAPTTASVTVTGEGAGCNTCGRVDRQQLAVTLQTQ